MVSAHLDLDVQTPTELLLAVAVAHGSWDREELLEVRGEHGLLAVEELKTTHGGRMHRLQAPTGTVVVDYRATVVGQAEPPTVDDLDLVEYLRPSRYADSDRLLDFARDQFGDARGADLLHEVTGWVGNHVRFLPGVSLPTDGATDTLLKRRGVCRDFAHLTIALLRARDMPARLVSVYAPGLDPMDFHAVVEAYVDGAWQVADATGMAPLDTMVRIATGRDAADTAFCSSYGGAAFLRWVTVAAQAYDVPAPDDPAAPAVLH
ncbi:MAG TPA: transglutaminase family protein [Cellulomonas sp.]